MNDITWAANYANQAVECEHHGERNSVVACPVCVGEARVLLSRYERLENAVLANAAEIDFCIVCLEHPSHGHGRDCIFQNERTS